MMGYMYVRHFYELIANSTDDINFCVRTHIIVNSTPDQQLIF